MNAVPASSADARSFTDAKRVLTSVLAPLEKRVLIWLGDSLDGTLARVRHHERPRYGFYVDHVVDEFGAAFLLGGLALSGYMSPAVAVGLLVAYLMLSAE